MNKIYKVIFNRNKNRYEIVSELASSRGGKCKVKAGKQIAKLFMTGLLATFLSSVALAADEEVKVKYDETTGTIKIVKTDPSTNAETILASYAVGGKINPIEPQLYNKETTQSAPPTGIIAIGDQSKAVQSNSIAIGADAHAGDLTPKKGTNYPVDNSNGYIAIGTKAVASGDRSIALGNLSSDNGGSYNIVQGKDSIGIGTSTSIFGYSGVSIGRRNIIGIPDPEKISSEGVLTTKRQNKSYGEEDPGGNSVIVGAYNVAYGNRSSIIGTYSRAMGSNSVAIGSGVQSLSDGAIAIGKGSGYEFADGSRFINGEDTKDDYYGRDWELPPEYQVLKQVLSNDIEGDTRYKKTSGRGKKYTYENKGTLPKYNNYGAGSSDPGGFIVEGENALGIGTYTQVRGDSAIGLATGEMTADLSDKDKSQYARDMRKIMDMEETLYAAKEALKSGSTSDKATLEANVKTAEESLAAAKKEFRKNYLSKYSFVEGEGALGVGRQILAQGDRSMAVGDFAKAISNDAIAYGGQTLANGTNSMAMGGAAKVGTEQKNYDNSMAIGSHTNVQAGNAVALGAFSQVTGTNSLALGFGTQSSTDSNNITYNSVSGHDSTLIGSYGNIAGNNSILIGSSGSIANDRVVGLGNNINIAAADSDDQENNTAGSVFLGDHAGYVKDSKRARSLGEVTLVGSEEKKELTESLSSTKGALRDYTKDFIYIYMLENQDDGTKIGAPIAVRSDFAGGDSTVGVVSVGSTYEQNFNSLEDIKNYHTKVGSLITVPVEVEVEVTKNGIKLGKQNQIRYFAADSTREEIYADSTLKEADKEKVWNTIQSKTSTPNTTYTVFETRRIQNVAPGLIGSNSTDAINGSQLFATNQMLGNLVGSLKKTFGDNVTITPDGQIKVSGEGTLGWIAKANTVDGSNGKVTYDVDKETDETEEAYQARIAKLKKDGYIVDASKVITFKAGKNIGLVQKPGEFSISTIDTPSFKSVELRGETKEVNGSQETPVTMMDSSGMQVYTEKVTPGDAGPTTTKKVSTTVNNEGVTTDGTVKVSNGKDGDDAKDLVTIGKEVNSDAAPGTDGENGIIGLNGKNGSEAVITIDRGTKSITDEANVGEDPNQPVSDTNKSANMDRITYTTKGANGDINHEVATLDDGFMLTTSTDVANSKAPANVKLNNTIKFTDGANTKVSTVTSDDNGVYSLHIDVNGLPVVYTDEDGNKLTKVGDKFYKDDQFDNGTLKPNATPSDAKNISIVNPDGSISKMDGSAPTTVNNVGSSIGGDVNNGAPKGSTINGEPGNNSFIDNLNKVGGTGNDAISKNAVVTTGDLKNLADTPLFFAGDSADGVNDKDTTADKNAFGRKLSQQMKIVGGVDLGLQDSATVDQRKKAIADKLTDGNIGVISDGSDTLTVKLAKNLMGLDSTTYTSPNATSTMKVDGNGVRFVDNNGDTVNNTPTFTTDGITGGNKTITDVASGIGGEVKDPSHNNANTFLENVNKIGAPTNGISENIVVNAGDLKNLVDTGFKLNTSGHSGDAQTVKIGETIKVVDGANTKVSDITPKDGVYEFHIDVNGLPMSYVDSDGNPLTKIGDKFYKTSALVNGVPPAGTDEVPANKVTSNVSMLDNTGSHTGVAPQIKNVGSGLVDNNGKTIKPNELLNMTDANNPVLKNAVNVGDLKQVAAVAKTEVTGTGEAFVTDTEAKDGHIIYNVHVDKILSHKDAAGNELVRGGDGKYYTNEEIKDKTYIPSENKWYSNSDLTNGKPNQGAQAVTPNPVDQSHVKTSLVNPNAGVGTGTDTSMTLDNVKSGIGGKADNGIKNGSTIDGTTGNNTFIENLDKVGKPANEGGIDKTTVVNAGDLKNLADTPLFFSGDAADGKEYNGAKNTKNTFGRKLSEEAKIVGGQTDITKLTDNNIGVVSNGTDTLTIKLAKELQNLTSVTTGSGDNTTVMNQDGVTITTQTPKNGDKPASTTETKLSKDGLATDGTVKVTNGKTGDDAKDLVTIGKGTETDQNATDKEFGTVAIDGKNGSNATLTVDRGTKSVTDKANILKDPTQPAEDNNPVSMDRLTYTTTGADGKSIINHEVATLDDGFFLTTSTDVAKGKAAAGVKLNHTIKFTDGANTKVSTVDSKDGIHELHVDVTGLPMTYTVSQTGGTDAPVSVSKVGDTYQLADGTKLVKVGDKFYKPSQLVNPKADQPQVKPDEVAKDWSVNDSVSLVNKDGSTNAPTLKNVGSGLKDANGNSTTLDQAVGSNAVNVDDLRTLGKAATTEVTGTGAAEVTKVTGANGQNIYNVHVERFMQVAETDVEGNKVVKAADNHYYKEADIKDKTYIDGQWYNNTDIKDKTKIGDKWYSDTEITDGKANPDATELTVQATTAPNKAVGLQNNLVNPNDNKPTRLSNLASALSGEVGNGANPADNSAINGIDKNGKPTSESGSNTFVKNVLDLDATVKTEEQLKTSLGHEPSEDEVKAEKARAEKDKALLNSAVTVADLQKTLQSPLFFEGDSADGVANENDSDKNTFARKLSQKTKIVGGVDLGLKENATAEDRKKAIADKLTDGNIGVISDGSNTLTVKLAKNLVNLTSVETGSGDNKTKMTENGITTTVKDGDTFKVTTTTPNGLATTEVKLDSEGMPKGESTTTMVTTDGVTITTQTPPDPDGDKPASTTETKLSKDGLATDGTIKVTGDNAKDLVTIAKGTETDPNATDKEFGTVAIDGKNGSNATLTVDRGTKSVTDKANILKDPKQPAGDNNPVSMDRLTYTTTGADGKSIIKHEVATLDDGFFLTTEHTEADKTRTVLFNHTIKVLDGANTKVSAMGGKDGTHTFSIDVTGLPVTYTATKTDTNGAPTGDSMDVSKVGDTYQLADGTKLVKVGDKYYTPDQLENGQPKPNAEGLTIKQSVSLVQDNGAPATLERVGSGRRNGMNAKDTPMDWNSILNAAADNAEVNNMLTNAANIGDVRDAIKSITNGTGDNATGGFGLTGNNGEVKQDLGKTITIKGGIANKVNEAGQDLHVPEKSTTDKNTYVNVKNNEMVVEIAKDLIDLDSVTVGSVDPTTGKGETTKITGKDVTIKDKAGNTNTSTATKDELTNANGDKTTVEAGKVDVSKKNADGTTSNTNIDGSKITLENKDKDSNTVGSKTDIGTDGIKITYKDKDGNTDSKKDVSLTDKGLNNGGNQIKNVGSGLVYKDGSKITDIAGITDQDILSNGVNVGDLQKAINSVTNSSNGGGFGLTGNNGQIMQDLGKTITVKGGIANKVDEAGQDLHVPEKSTTDQNTYVNVKDSEMVVEIAKDLTDLDSVTIGNVDKDGKGGTVINKDSMTVKDKDGKNSTNIGAGTIGTSKTDGNGNTSSTNINGSHMTLENKDKNGKLTGPKTEVSNKGITITPVDKDGNPIEGKKVELSDTGLDNGGNQIKHVDSGLKKENGDSVKLEDAADDMLNNAVNVGDLKSVNEKLKDDIINISNQVDDIKNSAPVVYTDANGKRVSKQGDKFVNEDGIEVKPHEIKLSLVNVDGKSTTTPSTLQNVAEGVQDTDAVNVKQLKEATEKPLTFNGDAGSSSAKLGETVAIKGGANSADLTDNNIGVIANSSTKTLNVKLSKKLKGLESAEFVDNNGNTTNITGDGVHISGGNGSNVSLTSQGLNNGGNRITNVAPGVEATDAVNVSQLNQVGAALHNRINNVAKGAYGGVASAGAMASLPQAYLPGKSMVAAGASHYRGESAVALGASRISDNGKIILKLNASHNTSGNTMVGAGVGYQF